ncbi:hypothetical protein GJAV_G00085760 [Gymnothorax javanicus]|nr:hypothetical protein GJAV_G00085760 [Gymnothorax javanicus]
MDTEILQRGDCESKELRIVLLGGRWGGKSSAGNTILGEERLDSGRQRTTKSRSQHATVAGRKITLVDTPGWKGYLSLRETTAADREEIKRSVCECFPGPHAFLLVIPVDSAFTEEHKRSLVDHLKLLGDRVWRYAMVLFTCGDWLREKTIEEHIKTEGSSLQWVIEKCRNRVHVISNRNREDRTQVTELLEKIEEMVAGNDGGHFEVDEGTFQAMMKKMKAVEEKAKERKMQMDNQRDKLRRLSQGVDQPSELRVVLLGSRNSGKSASGNTILDSEEFDIKKGTSKSVVRCGCVEGMDVTIVDTPGWWKDFSILDTTNQGKLELKHSVYLCPPGPHIFLLVIDTDVAFTERQREAMEEHLQLISEHVWNHTMVLFSRADWLGNKSIEEHIEEEGKALQQLVEKCGNRYHALDNKSKDSKAQVAELLLKMKEMVVGNGGSFHAVDETALQTIEECRKELEEKAKLRMTKVMEQRKRFQGTNNHLPEMRLVLMGEKSSGKSASANTILGLQVFPSSESLHCEMDERLIFGRRLTVVSTPGWWDNPARSSLEQEKEIMEGLSLRPPGPHAILLVIPIDMAYKEKHRRALLDHLGCLGENVWRHIMVLFTYGDRLGDMTVEQHIEREGWPLQWVVEKCENRYHLLNNKSRDSGAQVAELLEKVEEMVAGNDEEHFSPDMSQVHLQLDNKFKRNEAEEIKESYLEELNRREKEMKAQFEEEWKRRERELLEKVGDRTEIKPKHRNIRNKKESKIQKPEVNIAELKKRLQLVKTSSSEKSGEGKQMKTSQGSNLPKLTGATISQNSILNFFSQRRNSLELGPPSIGGSTEHMQGEDTPRPQNSRSRRKSWSPFTFSASSIVQDSGLNSTFSSVQSFSISEYQEKSDVALTEGTGSR